VRRNRLFQRQRIIAVPSRGPLDYGGPMQAHDGSISHNLRELHRVRPYIDANPT
jgi:hypothetical protein